MNDKGNNTMYSVEDYLMKEKHQKSVFSSESTVKRYFVLDFSVRAFYYKQNEGTTQCKPISSFREIVEITEFDCSNAKIKESWPFGVTIETLKQTITVYFDNQ